MNTEQTLEHIIHQFESHADEHNVKGMARFGIDSSRAFGIKLPFLRSIAKPYRKDHMLALRLWESGYHEARLMAIFIEDPKQMEEWQIEKWLSEFYSWDITDQACLNLFVHSPKAYEWVEDWSHREPTFEKRAAFALMAALAVHDKKAENKKFVNMFPVIIHGSDDARNFVKKAVNWALRQIGKRNMELHEKAIETAEIIAKLPYPSARWIASDALREFRKPEIIARIRQ